MNELCMQSMNFHRMTIELLSNYNGTTIELLLNLANV